MNKNTASSVAGSLSAAGGVPLVDLTQSGRIPVLMSLVDSLSRATAPQQVLDAAMEAIRKAFGPRCYLSLSTQGLAPGQFRLTRWITLDGTEHVSARNLRHDLGGATAGLADVPVQSGGLLSQLTMEPAPKLVQGLRLASDPVLGESVRAFGSLIAAPVFIEGQPASWTVILHEDDHGLGVADLEQLILRGNLLATSLNNQAMAAQLREATDWIRHEVDHVASIQRALSQQAAPKIPGLEIATWFDAYDRSSGDYYDILPLTVGLDGRHLEEHQPWGLLIADAAGHGAAAAVIIAMLHAVLHAREPFTAKPAALLSHLNQRLFARRMGSEFVTVFAATYDPASRRLSYANAGHNPPLLRRANGRIEALDSAGTMPLGVLDAIDSGEAQVVMGEGDTLLLYTDGVTEAVNPAGRQFGQESIEAVLASAAGSAERAIEAVTTALRRHESGEKPRDDQTMIALHVVGL